MSDAINPDLLSILACPDCHTSLEYQNEKKQDVEPKLVCASCFCVYPIDEGIPLLISDKNTPF